LDLLTPAKTWATAENNDTPELAGEPAEHMPRAQQIVMFFSVAGPFAGLLLGIVLLWRRNSALGIGWPAIVALLAMYALTGFGVTIGFHRLLTHRSFECPRWLRLFLAACGSAAGQGMCIRWCATHRRHHQVSDREGDPHSPHGHDHGAIGFLRGFWHAHVGWCFLADRGELSRSIPDLLSDRALLLIDQLYFFWVALGILIPGIILGLYTHGWRGFVSGMIWGGLVRIFLTQHVTWSVNSVCHVWGGRPFKTADHSANNFTVAILSLGEGWHNNHHAFPASARHGLSWWQFDSSYFVIKVMSALGLAWRVRVPDEGAIEAKLKTPEVSFSMAD
jgi:stearoyl-CoA desaturase (Delta-9 desaturase)